MNISKILDLARENKKPLVSQPFRCKIRLHKISLRKNADIWFGHELFDRLEVCGACGRVQLIGFYGGDSIPSGVEGVATKVAGFVDPHEVLNW